jgi:hypothetical protein
MLKKFNRADVVCCNYDTGTVQKYKLSGTSFVGSRCQTTTSQFVIVICKVQSRVAYVNEFNEFSYQSKYSPQSFLARDNSYS